MRTITPEQRQALEDLSAEGKLKGLPVQTAEKDIHITELLRALSTLEVHHDAFSDLKPQKGETTRHDTGIKLVFAGGTCLSKAHGLIRRMSEDVDIKVILTPTDKPLTKNRGDRFRLKALHDLVPQLLGDLGFPLLQYEEGKNPNIKDSHRYYVVGAGYKSSYDALPSLRPELKLELIQRHPLLPLEKRSFGYLYESLAELESKALVTVDCISVAETAAEKVVSLLRRCAYNWDGHQKKGDLDPALVRHVYDVARIAQLNEACLADARSIFPTLVQNDQQEFAGQNPEFDADRIGVLKRTLVAARKNGELKARYETNLLPLVYDLNPATFEESFAVFEGVAREFLDAC
jgi:hypothetical protein